VTTRQPDESVATARTQAINRISAEAAAVNLANLNQEPKPPIGSHAVVRILCSDLYTGRRQAALRDRNLVLNVAPIPADDTQQDPRNLSQDEKDVMLVEWIRRGDPVNVKAAIAAGANPSAALNTPSLNNVKACNRMLLDAIKDQDADAVGAALAAGANVHVDDELPLEMAVNHQNMAITQILLDAGADARVHGDELVCVPAAAGADRGSERVVLCYDETVLIRLAPKTHKVSC